MYNIKNLNNYDNFNDYKNLNDYENLNNYDNLNNYNNLNNYKNLNDYENCNDYKNCYNNKFYYNIDIVDIDNQNTFSFITDNINKIKSFILGVIFVNDSSLIINDIIITNILDEDAEII